MSGWQWIVSWKPSARWLEAGLSLGLVISVICPLLASAQIEPEYVTEVQACQELRKAGRFQDALANCRRAYTLNRDARLLYTIAELYDELEQPEEALAAYRHFLQKGGDPKVNGVAQRRVERLLRVVEANTAEVAVVTEPAGAEVFVDDNTHPIGLTPMSARLRPGAHTVRLILAGYRTVDVAISLTRGGAETVSHSMVPTSDTATLRIEVPTEGWSIALDGKVLGESPVSTVLQLPGGVHTVEFAGDGRVVSKRLELRGGDDVTVEPPTDDEPPSGRAQRVAAWSLTGLGGAAVIAGGGFLAGSAAAFADAEDLQAALGPGSQVDFDGRVEVGRSRRTVGWVVLGLGAASLGVGLVLMLVDGPDTQDGSAAASTPGGWSWSF